MWLNTFSALHTCLNLNSLTKVANTLGTLHNYTLSKVLNINITLAFGIVQICDIQKQHLLRRVLPNGRVETRPLGTDKAIATSKFFESLMQQIYLVSY